MRRRKERDEQFAKAYEQTAEAIAAAQRAMKQNAEDVKRIQEDSQS